MSEAEYRRFLTAQPRIDSPRFLTAARGLLERQGIMVVGVSD